ncbi:MAG: anaerobic glycerol-3-phosphate dehydrogenase subunit A [Deferribacteraceae bacterium]|jgi:glycerol-3-phosphate dehydrogenase|nr:anaerobic glycerol-3-phosphate dehydrogenase subunit A [Deferribacteraceae bacterium]
MKPSAPFSNNHYPVIIIGGGITGIGILRDLSMRGIKALLVEQKDLCTGTSSHFHGLLHSGARYAVSDGEAAKECMEENLILKEIAPHAIERTEGFFVSIDGDEPAYAEKWVAGCAKAGIPTARVDLKTVVNLEPNLRGNMTAVYRVPDSAVDGFRLIWQNAYSAQSYGGVFRTYAAATAIHSENGAVTGITITNILTGESERISCDYLVNAAGSWVAAVARLADIPIGITPDRGLLIAFNYRFTERVINRLHPAGDADIFVPHGAITIFGTTSVKVENPADTAVSSKEALYMLNIGEKVFPELKSYRILRGFAGTRPLFSNGGGRDATRNFMVMDHENDGLKGFISIAGGKLTTYRLMAEKTSDLVCKKMGIDKPCRTRLEPLVKKIDKKVYKRARAYFPKLGIDLSISRQGDNFRNVLNRIASDKKKSALLCECELVTRGEFEEVLFRSGNYPIEHLELTLGTLSDVRRRTRIGMGTCQGNFCAYRGVGTIAETGGVPDTDLSLILNKFIEERWAGIRPLLWGVQLKEAELSRGIYQTILNSAGEPYEE